MIQEYLTTPILLLLIFNIGMFILSFVVFKKDANRAKFFSFPAIIQKLYVILLIGPICVVPVLEQPRFAGSTDLPVYVGLVVSCLSVMFWAAAFSKIGVIPSVREKKGLVTGGIYGFVRNPIYTGNILIAFGSALIFKSIVALMYAPFVALFFGIICLLEEKVLSIDYGNEYAEYKRNVKYRLIPFVF